MLINLGFTHFTLIVWFLPHWRGGVKLYKMTTQMRILWMWCSFLNLLHLVQQQVRLEAETDILHFSQGLDMLEKG